MELNEPYAKERGCPFCGMVVAHSNAWICGKCGAYFNDRPQREKKYTITELEKLVSYYARLYPGKEENAIENFGKFLKDRKRVKEILEKDD